VSFEGPGVEVLSPVVRSQKQDATKETAPAPRKDLLPEAVYPAPAASLPGVGGPASVCCDSGPPCCPSGDCCCCADSVYDEGACQRFWVRGEYLLWSIKDSRFPVLVATGPGNVAPVLGAPGTVSLFGGPEPVSNELRSGARFSAGWWFDCCQSNGIDASFFFLGPRSVHLDVNSNEFPIIVRPFTSTATGAQSIEVTARPGQATGGLTIDSSSYLWGADVNWRHNLLCGCNYRVDGLLGFRYLDLHEALTIREDLTTSATFGAGMGDAANFANTRFLVLDRFDVRNQFYGGQVGLDAEFRRNRWSLDVTGKLALGSTHQVADVIGSEVLLRPGVAPQAFPGGLLALPSNIGQHTRDNFSVVPEVGVRVGYNLTDNLKVFVGYNVLWWTSVARPGDQIDTNLNPRLIPNFTRIFPGAAPPGSPNLATPTFQFHDSTFWANGMTAGLEYRW
jgi:hypothetical protein